MSAGGIYGTNHGSMGFDAHYHLVEEPDLDTKQMKAGHQGYPGARRGDFPEQLARRWGFRY